MTRAATKTKPSKLRVSPKNPGKSARQSKSVKQENIGKDAQKLMNSYSKYFAPPTENANEFKIVTIFDYTLPTTVTTHV